MNLYYLYLVSFANFSSRFRPTNFSSDISEHLFLHLFGFSPGVMVLGFSPRSQFPRIHYSVGTNHQLGDLCINAQNTWYCN